jgi:hypothetical protein
MKVLEIGASIMAMLLFATAVHAQAFLGASVSSFGAAGNGTTDDTAAFSKCLSTATNPSKVCWVDAGKTYLVGNVVMNSGFRLQGLGMADYPLRTAQPVIQHPNGPGPETTARPILKMKTGAGFILDVRNLKGAGAIHGLFLDCNNTTGTSGISGGSFELSLEHVTVVRCETGFGGADYTGGAHVTNSSFGFNGNGIVNIIDSFILNADFANNLGNGVFLTGGSNANNISNSRFEWNDGFGIASYGGATLNAITNCFFDRNKKAGIFIYGGVGFTISNSTFQGNGGNNAAYDENAQIVINESKNVTIEGGVSMVQKSATNGTTDVPQYVVSFSAWAGASKNVTIVGLMTSGQYNASTNPTGGYTAGVLQLGATPTNFTVRGVLGVADR